MDIKAAGDVIRILKHAKKITEEILTDKALEVGVSSTSSSATKRTTTSSANVVPAKSSKTVTMDAAKPVKIGTSDAVNKFIFKSFI